MTKDRLAYLNDLATAQTEIDRLLDVIAHGGHIQTAYSVSFASPLPVTSSILLKDLKAWLQEKRKELGDEFARC